MPKREEIIYETRALRKQEEMGCKVEGLVIGRRRPLIVIGEKQTIDSVHGHGQAVGW